jgi:hypothetical protein
MAFAPVGLSWSRRLYSDATHRGNLLPRRFKTRSTQNKNAGPDKTGPAYLFGSGGVMAFAAASLSYVGRHSRPDHPPR